MARLMSDCFCCTLKTGCVLIAAYTMFLAVLLLIFNVNDVVVVGNAYVVWPNYTSLVFAGLLILASLCLFRGAARDRADLMGVWLVIFFIYSILSLANVAYNIHRYRYDWVDARIHDSILADMIIFGLLFFVDILCLLAVYSQRQHVGGFSILP
ncbi:hypothetical protein BV898_08557 [Hypsibius exemplaris]|uniref:MARVEL domain-containing protein n=1 Tax=Hypsibius exemplaris TaxID=2072580 RepID=A0A1W0WQ82_HYPEX|nr:hypothetical protein BV898_08557 [Hypsibius exemplaris]